MSTPSACPICETPWSTMRAVKGCPACGIPLGAETQTVNHASPSLAALLLVGAALFLIAATGQPWGRWQPGQIFLLSAGVLLTGLVLSRRRRRAVLWEGGFVLLGRKKDPERFFWEKVTDLRWDESNKRLELRRGDGQLVMSVGAAFFGGHRRAERFRTVATSILQARQLSANV